MSSDQAIPTVVSPLLPLAVLESVQALDVPVRDELDEHHAELAGKRFGMSRTVADQVERLKQQVRRGRSVPADELVALLRLIGRRKDSGLVFTDAGRRLGRRLVAALRVPRGLMRMAGWPIAQRRAHRLGVVLRRTDGIATAALDARYTVDATPDGAACAFVGATLAELLRSLTPFDGAMIHTSCRARGAPFCEWRAAEARETR